MIRRAVVALLLLVLAIPVQAECDRFPDYWDLVKEVRDFSYRIERAISEGAETVKIKKLKRNQEAKIEKVSKRQGEYEKKKQKQEAKKKN